MFSTWQLIAIAAAYVVLLFAVAYFAEKRAARGRSFLRSPMVYALSLAIYCTSWTFYGSVGRATNAGLGFLPIYLGPTLAFGLGWYVLHKIIVISREQRTTSIADFIAARYGKSEGVAGLVAVIALFGTVPYIALQLKAVSTSLEVVGSGLNQSARVAWDASFMVASALAAFSMLFGARHIDASEQHEGVIVAVAFESVVKLVAFLAVGAFVTYGLYGGFGDIFAQAQADPEMARLLSFEAAAPNWAVLTLLAALAIICLPRQFHVTVIGNVDESHLRTAVWMFPLYLFLINLFVVPIALAGMLQFGDGSVSADVFVLALPMAAGQDALALLVFIGGLSAATAMVIVATVAVSVMVSNHLVMPILLKTGLWGVRERSDLTGVLLGARRLAMLFTIALGFLYEQTIGSSYALVSIGLVAFAAAAQFAPALLGGVYWRRGTRLGALAGLGAGFAVWTYTLFLPSLAPSAAFVQNGLFGISALRPYALAGLDSLDPISHAFLWSMLANIGGLVGVSLATTPSMVERNQATLFVDAMLHEQRQVERSGLSTGPALEDLITLGGRFVGRAATDRALRGYARSHDIDLDKTTLAEGGMVRLVERLIAGAIGAASARVAIASMLRGEGSQSNEILRMLDETSQVLEYSRQLEQKSNALEAAGEELKRANLRLQELDALKDEFLSTVTHELRTPLTSIRALTELMFDEPDMEPELRQEYLDVVIHESERLTRLINNVLDTAKIEAGQMEWRLEQFDLAEVAERTTNGMRGLFETEKVGLTFTSPGGPMPVEADMDRVSQVLLNLLSNALKFSPKGTGTVHVTLSTGAGDHSVRVSDDGPGVPEDQREAIFDRFHQVNSDKSGNPAGTGLGLAICRKIVEHMGGRIWVDRADEGGSEFIFTLPVRT